MSKESSRWYTPFSVRRVQPVLKIPTRVVLKPWVNNPTGSRCPHGFPPEELHPKGCALRLASNRKRLTSVQRGKLGMQGPKRKHTLKTRIQNAQPEQIGTPPKKKCSGLQPLRFTAKKKKKIRGAPAGRPKSSRRKRCSTPSLSLALSARHTSKSGVRRQT